MMVTITAMIFFMRLILSRFWICQVPIFQVLDILCDTLAWLDSP